MYNGYRFRSRLEARWAVFFDALGVKYEYEPEGYKLPNGMCYLPDFKVKCYGTRGDKNHPFDLYIEVKGMMTKKDADKIFSFCNRNDESGQIENPVLVLTEIPAHGVFADWYAMKAGDNMNGIEIYPFNYYTIDGDYFGAYPAADSYGHFYLFGDDGSYINEEDVPRIIKAYDLARQARFEHEESKKGHKPWQHQY